MTSRKAIPWISLSRLLPVVLLLPLLIPQGYCLCHGFETATFSTHEPGEPEEEHLPGCPAAKAPYVQATKSPVEVPLATNWISPSNPELVPVEPVNLVGLPQPFRDTSDCPTYLVLRTLLI